MTSSSTLYDDLNMSSSSDEDGSYSVSVNAELEQNLLRSDDEEPEDSAVTTANVARKTGCSAPKPTFFMDQRGNDGERKKINGNATAGTSSKMIKTSTGKVRQAISGLTLDGGQNGDVDLDEICRQRNILAPPHAPRRRYNKFSHDRPITGTGQQFSKCYQSPSSLVPLDDIVRAKDHHTIRRRQLPATNPKAAETNFENRGRAPQTNYQNQDKLRRGVETITEPNMRLGHDAIPEHAVDGNVNYGNNIWRSLHTLVDMGYSIYWEIKTLRFDGNLTENQVARMFRCLIRYTDIEGVCEAQTRNLAEQGAAAQFLVNLGNCYPDLRKFHTEVYEGYLIDASVSTLLADKLKELHGPDFKTVQEVKTYSQNSRTYSQCNLKIGASESFEGISCVSMWHAKLIAAKKALQKLFPEVAYPVLSCFMGKEQCTRKENVDAIYHLVYSSMTHCYDLNKVNFVPIRVMRQEREASGKSYIPEVVRQDRAVYVPLNRKFKE